MRLTRSTKPEKFRLRRGNVVIYDYTKQCWIETTDENHAIVLKCGHTSKLSFCYACAHAGEKIETTEDVKN
jgi:hypothetical protein